MDRIKGFYVRERYLVLLAVYYILALLFACFIDLLFLAAAAIILCLLIGINDFFVWAYDEK